MQHRSLSRSQRRLIAQDISARSELIIDLLSRPASDTVRNAVVMQIKDVDIQNSTHHKQRYRILILLILSPTIHFCQNKRVLAVNFYFAGEHKQYLLYPLKDKVLDQETRLVLKGFLFYKAACLYL